MIRTVYVYLVTGSERTALIDTGVLPSREDVLSFIRECGKEPQEVDEIVITHAHTDHIGGLKRLKTELGATAAASQLSCRWIEDTEAQRRERPVPNFEVFVEGPAVVERKLQPGDVIDLGGSTLTAYAAPGHELGQLAYFHKEDGVLFTADAIPVPGEMPIYDDLSAEVATLRRLMEIKGVKTLLMSWAPPYIGKENARNALEDGLHYIKKIHTLVSEGMNLYSEDEEAVAKYVHGALKLPPASFNGMFMGTIKAHIREIGLDI